MLRHRDQQEKKRRCEQSVTVLSAPMLRSYKDPVEGPPRLPAIQSELIHQDTR